jgi:hypothetical protein
VTDRSKLIGAGVFGPAYQSLFLNDAHAPNSVDPALTDTMVRLCDETAGYLYDGHTPTEVAYQPGTRPELERHVAEACADRSSDEARVAGIARFCSGLGCRAPESTDALRLGGTEEEIIGRGSAWCTDVARVGCAMCQVAGLPARLVYLADTDTAYSGHAVIEVFRGSAWGAVCAATGVVYRHTDGRGAPTWDLMNDADLVRAHDGAYLTPGQFRAAAVANYFVWEAAKYDYTVSGVNAYYRSILERSALGWPGGLRWLHGEDTGAIII